MDGCCSHVIVREFINRSSSLVIHEHDFVPIMVKEKEEQKSIICLTCGLFYCEECGEPLVRTTINDKKLIQHSNNLRN